MLCKLWSKVALQIVGSSGFCRTLGILRDDLVVAVCPISCSVSSVGLSFSCLVSLKSSCSTIFLFPDFCIWTYLVLSRACLTIQRQIWLGILVSQPVITGEPFLLTEVLGAGADREEKEAVNNAVLFSVPELGIYSGCTQHW